MTMNTPKVDLVLLWHMHQPDYRDAANGRFVLPWVYLHAAKDYADMAGHLERHPGVRAVVNFVPVLLEQLEDYARQFEGGDLRDPLLELLCEPDLDSVDPQRRAILLESCFHSNRETMLAPFPNYVRLHQLYLTLDEGDGVGLAYLSGAYLADLVTWYHLSWIGEAQRRGNALFGELMTQGRGFSSADRMRLFHAIGDIVRGVPARFRALADQGRIELSTTPHTHPLAPLMIDFGCARQAMPLAPLPEQRCYPGGAERVRWHLEAATDTHARRFGEAPAGLWPAEGAISEPFLEQVAASGFRWAASSETVLRNSLGADADGLARERWLYRTWHLPQAPGLTLVFRDERLSDKIGFEYSKWHGRDAARDFVGELHRIAREAREGEVPLVLVALDGENAWEYYPYNGFYFFEELYATLEKDPLIRMRTLAQCAADPAHRTRELPGLVAGSWVLGTLSTWIGEPAKNRAWDLLCEAKVAYDEVLARGELDDGQRVAASRQLASCEGSDWFWWLGPYNPALAVARFERLFRLNLVRLYELIGRTPPQALSQPLSQATDTGHGQPAAGGTMRRAAAQA